MNKKMQIFLWSILLLLVLLLVVSFSFGLHRSPKYIQNFEVEEYGKETPFIQPIVLVNGLAVYAVGEGAPVLLLPYPHGHVTEPMAQGPIADILVGMGRQVITFDPPGAFYSTGNPDGSMGEMLAAADQAFEAMNVEGPVDIVGHSMGGLVALAYAVERPDRARRLVLVNSVSGFPAAARCGFPGSAFNIFEADYWRVILWGMRITAGRADLALHKQLYNLMGRASFHDPSLFVPLEIDDDDHGQGIPIRMIWSNNMYAGLSYADRLEDVGVPTLITAGRYDPEASMSCSEELTNGIAESRLVVFENSGHSPFLEEKDLFSETLGEFLGGAEPDNAEEKDSPNPVSSTDTQGAEADDFLLCQDSFERRELREPYQRFNDQPRYTLSKNEFVEHLDSIGIDSPCLPQQFGLPFVIADWKQWDGSAFWAHLSNIRTKMQFRSDELIFLVEMPLIFPSFFGIQIAERTVYFNTLRIK